MTQRYIHTYIYSLVPIHALTLNIHDRDMKCNKLEVITMGSCSAGVEGWITSCNMVVVNPLLHRIKEAIMKVKPQIYIKQNLCTHIHTLRKKWNLVW